MASGSGTMRVEVDGLEEILLGINQTKPNVAKAVNATCKDFQSRGPGWVTKAVTQEYTIKSSEVNDAIAGKHNLGHVTLSGVTLDDIRIEYRGRTLTFAHFRFTPKKPAGFRTGRKAKAITPGANFSTDRPYVWAVQRKNTNAKVTIHKGHKEVLRGRYEPTPFVASMNGSPMLPFQRKTSERSSAQSLKSTSIPQMISNEKVAKDIDGRINEELGKRLQHHLDRYSTK